VDSLLERQAVLAELGGLARQVRRGEGRVVLLRGEAGVGKTAVIARFLAGSNGSLRVLRGWCDPLATPRPLGPLIDALAGLSDAQAAGLAAAVDAGDTSALYRRLLGVWRDGQRWVWVIEDAHWADGATLDLLRFLARRIGTLPLLLVVSYRDEVLGGQHPLSVALGDIASCGALTRIGVAPLSREAVAVLAAGSGVNADQLYQLTGGNPFFVTEVLAAGPDVLASNVLPRSTAEAVWGRLGRLSAAARRTAHAVAVCGPRANPALVQAVDQIAGSALTECLDSGVLVADRDVVGFRHELARRATLDRIPDYQRRLLHKCAMAALAAEPIDPAVLAAMAFHADQAGDDDAVIRYGPPAAERAAALGAHSQAAELYALVLRHAHNTPDQQKVLWLEQHACESFLCGQAEAAASGWRHAIDIRHQLGDRLAEGEDLRRLSEVLLGFGRTSEASDAALASVRLLEQVGPGKELALAVQNMAQIAMARRDPAGAEYTARAMALGAQFGADTVVARATFYATLETVLSTGSGWDNLEAAWRDAMDTEGLAEEAALMGLIICWFTVLSRELDRAERYLAETSTFSDNHGFGMFREFVTGAGALAALHSGDWAGAALAADQVLTRPGLSALHRIMPLVTIALIRARRGEQPVAPLLDEAVSSAGSADPRLLGLVWVARAEAAWLAGDDETARTEAQHGLPAISPDASPWLVGDLRRWVHVAGGEPDATTDGPITPFDLEISGDWQAAAAAWTNRGCPYDAALAQLGGDIAAVQSALATFRRLGARAAARRAQQRLAALRGRTPRARRADTLADPNGLTRREREVLELLAAGRSDADIAAALHISPKTAGCHVSSILVKLRVDNRIQAAAHALQRQIAPKA